MIKRLLAATLIVSLTSCKTTTKVSSTVKVVGGTIAKPGQFPAALFIPNCSATRVGKTVVLTAAHCVTGAAIPNEDGVRKLQLKYSSDESIQIAIGTDTGKAQDVTIKEIWTEPSYLNMAGIPGAELRDLYDIALIKFHTLPHSQLRSLIQHPLILEMPSSLQGTAAPKSRLICDQQTARTLSRKGVKSACMIFIGQK